MGKSSLSKSPEGKKSKKEKKSHKQSRQRDRKSKDKKNKKDKDRDRSRSKDRQRGKDKERQKNKSRERDAPKDRGRSRQKDRIKQKDFPIKSKLQHQNNFLQVEKPQRQETEQERLRKFAIRKVRARLLKINQLIKGQNADEDDDDDQVVAPKTESSAAIVPPPPPPPKQQGLPKSRASKRESKWGKTSFNEPSIILVTEKENQDSLSLSKPDKNLSLEPDGSEDPLLKLSEDKSIDAEDFVGGITHLQPIEQQDIDPLDRFMMDIQNQAVKQIELPKKGASNTITFEDVVTSSKHFILEKTAETSEIEEDLDHEEEFKKKFLEAIASKTDGSFKQIYTNDRGIVMQNHEDKDEDLSDFHQQKEPQLDFFAKQRKMAERKELNQIDHSTIVYQDVRFNLYREAEEIKNMDQKDVIKYRKEAGDIKVRGRDILNPVFNWYQCGFSDRILNVIQKRQYGKPFPIQAQSMPLIMSGRDVIGIAETGSGKTLAYLLPMLKHVMDQKKVEEGEGPIGIIMTPTRQLARQVYMEAKVFCKSINIRVLAVYGGLGVQNQLADFRKGAQIVICTPGRMIDILTLNKGKITNLQRITMVVIDQADRMFDLGFQPQITRILDNIRPKRQSVMFSATFPKNVETLARRILNKPVQIIVGSRGQACRNVDQIVEVREETSKFLRLLQILGLWNEKGSILIFVDKQTQADFLFQQLLKYGYNTLVLHGAMDPDDRQFTIYDFKKGVRNILIATSVAARGLDIKSIVLVVNFKCPNHLEDYIHRIGRTGRAGSKGTAITFITPSQQQYSVDLLKALQMAELQPSDELIKLSQEYLGKVKKGQARKIRNRNIQGSGFKFDQEEEQKTNQIKDMIRKQMKTEGLGFDDDSDDDDIQLKKRKEEDVRGRNQQQRVAEAIKNPEVKNKLLNEAAKAVSQAIKNGAPMTTEKLLQIAVNSMKQSVTKHKIIKTVDDGVEQVTKLINQFQNKGSQGGDFFSYDYQINDYPILARQKGCNQQFLHGIQQLTNCTISLRGVYVQPGRKVPVGCRKLYLHIQGENKYYVSTAYKQIKRVLQENAYQNLHMGSAPGKYSI